MSSNSTAEPLINAREAAEMLRCNERTVKRLADEKKIPAMRIGNRWRFLASMLDEWRRKELTSNRSKH